MDNEKIKFSNVSLHINIQTLAMDGRRRYRGLHIHNEIELVYIRQGEILCTADGKQTVLKKGDLALINSRVRHALSYCGEEAVLTYLQIDLSKYAPLLFSDSKIKLPLLLCSSEVSSFGVYGCQSELYRCFAAITEELAAQRPHRDVYVKAGVLQLLAFLCRHRFYADSSEIEKNIQSILPAIAYIEANYSHKLTLEDISSALHISKYHFCKVFRSATGMTFSQYVNALRVYHAQTLLLDSRESISAIAYECGFGSTQNFNHFFKKALAITPKEYRSLRHAAEAANEPDESRGD